VHHQLSTTLQLDHEDFSIQQVSNFPVDRVHTVPAALAGGLGDDSQRTPLAPCLASGQANKESENSV
jgi:hypothetical protein